MERSSSPPTARGNPAPRSSFTPPPASTRSRRPKRIPNGNYVFNNLRPGNYVVKEVAPAGYTNDGVNPVSQLNPATPAGIDTIDVTVVNPSSVYLTSGGAVAASSASIRDTVDFLFGNTVTAGAYTATLGSTSGGSDLSPSFPTFLADALPSLSAGGGQSVQVTPTPLSQLNVNGLPISASAAGRIAFLLNTYGGTTLSNVQARRLQLAIWELTYDDGGTPNFSNGFFQANGPAGATTSAQFSAIIAQATTYYNASAGQDQTGAVLVAGQPSLFNLGADLMMCSFRVASISSTSRRRISFRATTSTARSATFNTSSTA